jgi:multidrug transporter EmrE-like cation transporter
LPIKCSIKRRTILNSAIPILLLSALTASVGQVAFKMGMSIAGGIQIKYNFAWIISFIKICLTPFVFAGLVLYAASTILWLVALSRCPLNYAYPFTAVTFILVILFSSILLHEPLPLMRVIGVAIIICGIIVVGLK